MGYTLGKRPLGYAGLGDFFVLLFFGWVGVGGSFVLMTGEVGWQLIAPATGIGLLAAGVLNINNLRDQEGDRRHGKRTMAVRLGDRGTRQYHLLLIGAGSYFLITTPFRWGAAGHWFVWVPALLVVVALRQAFEVVKTEELRRLNPSLGKLAMLTAVWGIALGAAMGAAAYA
jgi:1,4-dihydroxy-2-naphthoate octaprenyltransferase